MKNNILLTYKIASYTFIAIVFGYFLISLSLMTDLFTLATYQDYLKPEVLRFYEKLDSFNNSIFTIATTLTIAVALLLAFRIPKKPIGIKLVITLNVIAVFALIFMIVHYSQSAALLADFNQLDLSWQSTILTPEQVGFTEPSAFWLHVSTYWLLAGFVVSAIYLGAINAVYFILRKDVNHNEKTV